MTSSWQSPPDKVLQEQALQWFTRKQSGIITPEEEQAFAEWLASSERHASHYTKVSEFWDSPAFTNALEQSDSLFSYSERSDLKPEPKSNSIVYAESEQAPTTLDLSQKTIVKASRHKFWPIAASVVIMAFGLALFNDVRHADYLTDRNEQKHIMLDDGSQVTLNTYSAANVVVDNKIRKVELVSGEVYLDVVKDGLNRPFQVTAGEALVEVLGTQFSVKYEEQGLAVTGLSGRIAVSIGQVKPEIITKGEKINIVKGRLIKETINTKKAFSWLNRRLIFHKQPLREVVAELNRYYSGKIIIINEQAANTLITGSYSLKKPKETLTNISQIAKAQTVQLLPWVSFVY